MNYDLRFVIGKDETTELFERFKPDEFIKNSYNQLNKDLTFMDHPLHVEDHSLEAHMIHLTQIKKSFDIKLHNAGKNDTFDDDGKLVKGSPLNRFKFDDETKNLINYTNYIKLNDGVMLNTLKELNFYKSFRNYSNLNYSKNVQMLLNKIKIKNAIIEEAFEYASSSQQERFNIDHFSQYHDNVTRIQSSNLQF